MPTKKQKRNTIMLGVGGFITVATAFTILADLPDKIDPLIHTTSEAVAEHKIILAENDANEHAQAAFNAYALRSILEQEVETLKLKVNSEDDTDEKELLREELKAKQEFIRTMEAERMRQLSKGDDNE